MIVVVGALRISHGIGVGHAFAFLGLLGLGALLLYCFWLILATGSFWVINLGSSPSCSRACTRRAAGRSASIPGWLRYSMTYLVPVGFAVTVPAQALTNRLHLGHRRDRARFALALTAFTRWFWRFGLRRYSGASA